MAEPHSFLFIYSRRTINHDLEPSCEWRRVAAGLEPTKLSQASLHTQAETEATPDPQLSTSILPPRRCCSPGPAGTRGLVVELSSSGRR